MTVPGIEFGVFDHIEHVPGITLEARGAKFTLRLGSGQASPVEEQDWGSVPMLEAPGAGEVELYQPKYARG